MRLTASGWFVAVALVGGIGLGLIAGWTEFLALGAAAALLAAIAAVFLLGGIASAATLRVPAGRVSVGQSAEASIVVENRRSRRVLPSTIELGVDGRMVPLPVPAIAARSAFANTLPLPTSRRGVMTIGPITVVRSDPVALVRRDALLADAVEFTVHPETVTLPPSGTGLIRDLEGEPSGQLTESDLAFHAIREYQPGDDRRGIHWRSTAKTGTFMVRQFEQTRRSRIGLLLSLAAADYATAEGSPAADEGEVDPIVELAVSAVASIGLRALRDGQRVAAFASAGGSALAALPLRSPTRLLDALSRVRILEGRLRLAPLTALAAPRLTDASTVYLVAGPSLGAAELRRIASALTEPTRVIAVVCDPESVPQLHRIGTLTILRIGFLADLPRALWRAQEDV